MINSPLVGLPTFFKCLFIALKWSSFIFDLLIFFKTPILTIIVKFLKHFTAIIDYHTIIIHFHKIIKDNNFMQNFIITI